MTTYTISNAAQNQRQILQTLRSFGAGFSDVLPSRSARILSIGNSRIGTNTSTLTPNVALPRMFSLFLTGLSQQATWTDVTTFGISLREHWNAGIGANTARGAIRSKQYTHIILQDLGANPYANITEFNQNHLLYAAEIARYNPGAKILLLQNWANSDDSTYAETTATIENSYRSIAEIIGAEIIPCGRAWNAGRISPGFGTLLLYKSGDPIHPAMRGIYLNCACVYQTIFKANPTLSTAYIPSGMTAAETLQLSNIAWASFTEPLTPVTVTEVNVPAGRNLGKMRRLDIFINGINWNNGAGLITTINDKADPNSTFLYPTMPVTGWFVYQTGDTASQFRVVSADSIEKIQTFFLDPTKDTFLATNDGNFANNSGTVVANIRTYT